MTARKPKPTKRLDPDKPLTLNQMLAMFREVLEAPEPAAPSGLDRTPLEPQPEIPKWTFTPCMKR
jgi:hypothetical protein